MFVRRGEQTERVCAVNASFIPRATNTTCTVPWHVFQLCVRKLQMTLTTTHLGMVIEQTSGDPCSMARVPSKQATHAPRTKTGDFKMESQRQESQTMTHLKSRTKPPDTRPNLNHQCKSMTRTENHVPLFIANTTTGHATRPPTPRQIMGATTDKELHNLIRGTLADTKRHQIGCMHRDFWTIVPRDDGAIFLSAAKNQQRIRAPGIPPHLGDSSSGRRT